MALAPDRKGFFLLRTLLALTYRNWISFYSHFSHHYWIVPFLVLNVLMVNWNFSVSLIWTDFIASLWQDFMTNKGVTSDFFFMSVNFLFWFIRWYDCGLEFNFDWNSGNVCCVVEKMMVREGCILGEKIRKKTLIYWQLMLALVSDSRSEEEEKL